MPAMKKLYIIIVGCGRLGSYLANKLSRDGHSVVAIDIHASAFDALTFEFSGFRMEGDATEYAELIRAKIEHADILIATTREDNVNLMIAQIAKEVFKVPKVMARVDDPNRVKIYSDLGVETICPTTVAGDMFIDAIVKS
jgi:trk system potassium uptake protein TrkA